jgi:hypothetical protein
MKNVENFGSYSIGRNSYGRMQQLAEYDWPKTSIGRRHDWSNGTIGRKNIFTSKKEIKQFSTIMNTTNIEFYSFLGLLSKNSKNSFKKCKVV